MIHKITIKPTKALKEYIDIFEQLEQLDDLDPHTNDFLAQLDEIYYSKLSEKDIEHLHKLNIKRNKKINQSEGSKVNT